MSWVSMNFPACVRGEGGWGQACYPADSWATQFFPKPLILLPPLLGLWGPRAQTWQDPSEILKQVLSTDAPPDTQPSRRPTQRAVAGASGGGGLAQSPLQTFGEVGDSCRLGTRLRGLLQSHGPLWPPLIGRGCVRRVDLVSGRLG